MESALVCCASCPPVGLWGVHMNAPDMDCYSVAVSRAIGEGVFGMFVHSSSRICFHLGAMGRSHIGVELMIRLSLAQCSGFVEESSALMYVKAARSGRGRGLRMVGLPTVALYRLGSRGGRLSRVQGFVPSRGTSAPIGGPSVGGSWSSVGKVVPPMGSRPHPS